MNGNDTLSAVRNRLTEARDSLSTVHMTTPASEIVARARRHRIRRGLWAAGATCAAAGLAVSLALPSGGQTPSVHVHLAAWSVDTNSNGTVTVTVHQLTHAAQLQRALAEAGVPATVTFGAECLNPQNQGALARAGITLKASVNPPGEIINPAEIPRGTRLLFSLLPAWVYQDPGTGHWHSLRGVSFGWGLVNDGDPLHCTPTRHYSTSGTR